MPPTKEQIAELLRVHDEAGKPERDWKALSFDDTRTWVDQNGYRLSDRVWRARADVRAAIDQRLRMAVATGEDALEVARELEGYLNPDLLPSRNAAGRLRPLQRSGVVTRTPRSGAGSYAARRLVRTEISRAHAQATDEALKRTPGAVGWKWNVSSSHPEPDGCDDNAGSDVGLGPGVYRAGSGPTMPAHPHCFPAGTPVLSPPIVASMARWYDGELIEVRTAGGHFLAGTRNHPILTSGGWRPLGALREGGDVICSGLFKLAFDDPNDQWRPTDIEQVHEALSRTSAVPAERVKTAAEDFHGDGTDGYVDIIRADSGLRNAFDAAVIQPANKQQFVDGLMLEGLRLGRGDLAHVLDGVILSASGFNGSASNSPAVVLGGPPVGRSYAVRGAAQFNAGATKYAGNAGDRHAVRVGQSRSGFAIDITPGELDAELFLDVIVEIKERRFAGHVYNLQTTTGWYIAGGIIAHNCLCFKTIELEPTDDLVARLREEYGLDAPNPIADLPAPGEFELPKGRYAMAKDEAEAWAREAGGFAPDKPYYHFTDAKNVQSIAENGFRQHWGMYGRGTYFTEAEGGVGLGARGTSARLEIRSAAKRPFQMIDAEYQRQAEAFMAEYGGAETDFVKALRDSGYDAIELSFEGSKAGSPPWLIAFDPADIRVVQAVDVVEYRGAQLHALYPDVVDNTTLYRSAARTELTTEDRLLFTTWLEETDPAVLAKRAGAAPIRTAADIASAPLAPAAPLDDAELKRLKRNEASRASKAKKRMEEAQRRLEKLKPEPTPLPKPEPTPLPKPEPIEWKPAMTSEEAQAFAKQGALGDREFYHYTSSQYVDSIKASGLRVTNGVYGEFVYLTDDAALLDVGAKAMEKSIGRVYDSRLVIRAKVEKPFTGGMQDMFKLIGETGASDPEGALAAGGYDGWIFKRDDGTEWLLAQRDAVVVVDDAGGLATKATQEEAVKKAQDEALKALKAREEAEKLAQQKLREESERLAKEAERKAQELDKEAAKRAKEEEARLKRNEASRRSKALKAEREKAAKLERERAIDEAKKREADRVAKQARLEKARLERRKAIADKQAAQKAAKELAERERLAREAERLAKENEQARLLEEKRRKANEASRRSREAKKTREAEQLRLAKEGQQTVKAAEKVVVDEGPEWAREVKAKLRALEKSGDVVSPDDAREIGRAILAQVEGVDPVAAKRLADAEKAYEDARAELRRITQLKSQQFANLNVAPPGSVGAINAQKAIDVLNGQLDAVRAKFYDLEDKLPQLRAEASKKAGLDAMKAQRDKLDEIKRQVTETRNRIAQNKLTIQYGQAGTQVVADAAEQVKRLESLLKDLKQRQVVAEKAVTEPLTVADAIRGALKEVRPGYGEQKLEVKFILDSDKKTMAQVEKMVEWLPKEWVEAMNDYDIRAKAVQRGNFTPGVRYGGGKSKGRIGLNISGGTAAAQESTTLHELGHFAEWIKPDIVKAERKFFQERTAGEVERSLREITGNYAYRTDEYAKKDKFLNPYMGKEYAEFYELLTMGLQGLFLPTSDYNLAKDRDMYEWLIGLLASV